MPVNVRLRFVPPHEENLVKLIIYEGPTKDGAFAKIDETTSIGAYPTYIDEFTTSLATNPTDWFAIDWEDNKGATLGLSQAIQGGSLSLVGEIVDRVMLRDPTISENVALQEAEAAIQQYFNLDPYSIDESTVSYVVKRGLTLLALARVILVNTVSGTTASYTAGLVSQTTGNTQQVTANVKELLAQAMKDLGLSFSVISQMADIEIAGGLAGAEVDQSRLLVEIL